MTDRGPRATIEAIDAIWRAIFLARSLFPRMDSSLAKAGAIQWTPPGFYDESPYQLVIMKRPIQQDDVEQNNDVAHWLNENFIVRLYAVLQAFGVAQVDSPQTVGYDEYMVIRRLRNKLAHGSSGRYDKSEKEDREALERLYRVCPGFTPPDKYGGHFDLSISEVLWPLALGTRKYAAGVLHLEEPLWELEPTPPGHERTS